MLTAALFAVTFGVFLATAIVYYRARLGPEAATALGFTLLTLAVALTVRPVTPEPPEPPDPEPPATLDFGGIRPHLQGDGVTTPAGRGGPVCRITSLSSAGGTWNDGTVKGCLVAVPPGCEPRTGTQAACARTVISDVSGAIDFANSTLLVTGPYLSFWGSTAPSCSEGTGSQGCETGAGGLTFQRVQLNLDTHDTYWNHLRIRRGPPSLNPILTCTFNSGYDCTPVHSHVFDHLSIAWADMPPDGSSGVNNFNAAQPSNSRQVMADSIISEPLWAPPWGGLGIAFCGTLMRTLIAHAFDRAPIWSGGRCAFINNVTYNGSADLAGQALLSATTLYDPARLGAIETVMRDNVYLLGPTPGGAVTWTLGLYIESPMLTYGGGARIHLKGNTGPGITGATGDGQWTGVVPKPYDVRPNAATGGPASNVRTDSEPAWFTDQRFVIVPNQGTTIRDFVIANAGARPLDRDAADARVTADVVEGDGTSYLDWTAVQNLYGGQPVVVARTRACVLPADPTAPGSRTLADGTTNTRLEDYLEGDPACGARRIERLPATAIRRAVTP